VVQYIDNTLVSKRGLSNFAQTAQSFHDLPVQFAGWRAAGGLRNTKVVHNLGCARLGQQTVLSNMTFRNAFDGDSLREPFRTSCGRRRDRRYTLRAAGRTGFAPSTRLGFRYFQCCGVYHSCGPVSFGNAGRNTIPGLPSRVFQYEFPAHVSALGNEASQRTPRIPAQTPTMF